MSQDRSFDARLDRSTASDHTTPPEGRLSAGDGLLVETASDHFISLASRRVARPFGVSSPSLGTHMRIPIWTADTRVNGRSRHAERRLDIQQRWSLARNRHLGHKAGVCSAP